MAYDVCRLPFDQHGTSVSELALSRLTPARDDGAPDSPRSIFARRARQGFGKFELRVGCLEASDDDGLA